MECCKYFLVFQYFRIVWRSVVSSDYECYACDVIFMQIYWAVEMKGKEAVF